ncbi:hypothetical protein PRIC1_009220 [Phytophthora ramorum]
MGKASVLQVQQDVPGNASREVFQGLFKDLGKQAMALEAILRAVCGRVDKMENWLTEVSFGMTELDLKLRNIAHNIDGTAAVDDEAQGPHRWVTPPDETKPLAATVSKKLGTDKKAVRVTGMAAAILDRLATTSSVTTPTVADVEKVEKTTAKKKSKDKKHNSKKTKSNGSAEAAATPVAESVQTTETKPVPSTQHSPASIGEEVPATIHLQEPATSEEESVAEAPAEFDPPATLNEPEARDLVAPVLSQDYQVVVGIVAPSFESYVVNGQSGSSSSESSRVVSSREVIESNAPVEEVESQSEISHAMDERGGVLHPTEESTEKDTSSVPTITPAVQHVAPVLAQPSTTIAAKQIDLVGVAPAPSTATTTTTTTKTVAVATPAQKINDKRPISTPSVSSILPTVQVERTIEPFVLKAPIHATLPSRSVDVAVTTSELQAAPMGPTASTSLSVQEGTLNPVSTSQSVAVQSSSPPVGACIPTAVPQPSIDVKATEVPIRTSSRPHQDTPELLHHLEAAGPPTDPLLPRRAASHRRSSKMVPRTSINKKLAAGENDLAQRLSGNKCEPHSRRSSISQQVATQEQEPQEVILQQVAPTLQAAQQGASTSALADATDQADIDEKSGESDSEASADGSGSSSSDEDDEDDAEAGAAVEEISKTMIALKKLKRAHMLSPEEETELKERAHKKWFQLKGHIKEKQKKDVTNILLKRKKNVFTVSSRIELLEEKSREIFAALKQMTNEMREKNDRTTHETLRRRVTDIEQSLLSVDSRFASLSAPATEKAELFFEKLKQQPDYTVAIENLKRGLRRKADLKVLKELEARLLGLDAENEDCLVRCLSCRKEVVNPYNEKDTEAGDQESMNTGSGPSQLRKVNPGPSSARIYRSNVPFSAQPLVQESISEESPDELMLPPPQILTQPQPAVGAIAGPELHQQFQSAGDSYASEKPPAVRVPSAKWSAPPTDTSLKRDIKSAKASPLSLMNITATRAILSPDRPISAPAVPMKKKNPAVRSKSLLKSLTPQPEPPL